MTLVRPPLSFVGRACPAWLIRYCESWFGQDKQDWQDLGQVLGEVDYVDWSWGSGTQGNGVQRNGAVEKQRHENLVDLVHPV